MQVRAEKHQPPTQEDPKLSLTQKLPSTGQLLRILSRFDIREKLGSGSFGHIYKAFDLERNEIVALKIESHTNSKNVTLSREASILSEIKGGDGFPTIYYYSREEGYSVLAMSLLGKNLDKLFKSCNSKFSVKTMLMLADQMIRRIEYLHSRGYLHRDIKPENFVMGPYKDQKALYLIDFGLSKMYRDQNGKLHPYKEGRGLVGTARFASISTHLGIEQSRRDDLESIGYLIIYFLKGSLPWQKVQGQNKSEKYKLIAECKMNTPVEELCQDLPSEFTTYMNYVRKLTFTDQPDYKFIKKLFRQLLVKSGYSFDFEYDWYKIPDKTTVDLASVKEEMNQKLGQEDTVKMEKKLEVYKDIKLKALEFNTDFRGRNKNMELMPPRSLSKGKNQDKEPSSPGKPQEKLSMSPLRKTRGPGLFIATNGFVATVTTTYAKGSATDSPLYPRKFNQQMRNSSRHIMPEKPSFSLISIPGVSKGGSSSPQLSVNKGSLNELSDEFEDQDEKSPCDLPINQNTKVFAIKRLGEVKAKTIALSEFKESVGDRANRISNRGKDSNIIETNANNANVKQASADTWKK